MARKKSQQKAAGDRIPFQIRAPRDVHEKISKEATAANISMNLLAEGLLSGSVQRLIPGRPVIKDGGFVDVRDDLGCFFVGKRGTVYRYVPHERERVGPDDYAVFYDQDILAALSDHEVATDEREKDGKPCKNGFVWFVLDYSSSPVSFMDTE